MLGVWDGSGRGELQFSLIQHRHVNFKLLLNFEFLWPGHGQAAEQGRRWQNTAANVSRQSPISGFSCSATVPARNFKRNPFRSLVAGNWSQLADRRRERRACLLQALHTQVFTFHSVHGTLAKQQLSITCHSVNWTLYNDEKITPRRDHYLHCCIAAG